MEHIECKHSTTIITMETLYTPPHLRQLMEVLWQTLESIEIEPLSNRVEFAAASFDDFLSCDGADDGLHGRDVTSS